MVKHVNRKPPLARVSQFKLNSKQIELLGLKDFAVDYRTCYHCNNVYYAVKHAHDCIKWHEGLIDK